MYICMLSVTYVRRLVFIRIHYFAKRKLFHCLRFLILTVNGTQSTRIKNNEILFGKNFSTHIAFSIILLSQESRQNLRHPSKSRPNNWYPTICRANRSSLCTLTPSLHLLARIWLSCALILKIGLTVFLHTTPLWWNETMSQRLFIWRKRGKHGGDGAFSTGFVIQASAWCVVRLFGNIYFCNV
jgi:hypothetical protein